MSDDLQLRQIYDPPALRSSIMSRVLDAYTKKFPIENDRVRLELSDLRYGKKTEYTPPEVKAAKLAGKRLSVPLRGTVRLISQATGETLDERPNHLVANVPYLTDRGTFMVKGIEYLTANQTRLRPGLYARVKDNGELETHINAEAGTGPAMRMFMEPETGIYRLKVGESRIKLYPILKGLGVDDDELGRAWGPDVLEANRKADDPKAFAKFHTKMVGRFRKPRLDPDKDPDMGKVVTDPAQKTALFLAEALRVIDFRGSGQDPDMSGHADPEGSGKKASGSPWATFVVAPSGDGYAATTRAADRGEEGRIGLPGGKVDPGEDPLDAAIRESAEEGWDVSDLDPEPAHRSEIDGRPVWWYLARAAKMRDDYKEMGRISPVEVSLDEIAGSGYGNEWIAEKKAYIKEANVVVSGRPGDFEVRKDNLRAARDRVDTDPTEKQKDSGNYAKGHLRWNGLPITIENPRGSVRRGTDPDGNSWESRLGTDYGYVKGTKSGADGDHIDVMLGNHLDSESVFVVDQVNQDGSFDEHKILIGCRNRKEAKKAYLSNYSKGWKCGPITAMTLEQFKWWAYEGDSSKPVSDQSFPTFGEDWSQWYAFDLDGTLAETGGDFDPDRVGKPIAGMMRFAKDLRAAGATIKILTARAATPENIPVVERWLARNGLKGVEVTNRKDPGMVTLFDDRVVSVTKNRGIPVQERRRHVEKVKKEASADLQAYTIIPRSALESVRSKGLLTGEALLDDPEALAAMAEGRGSTAEEQAEQIRKTFAGWKPDSSRGVNMFTALPPDDFPLADNHPTKRWETERLKVDLGRYLKDNPGTRVHGQELVPYSEEDSEKYGDGYADMRHRDITEEELAEIAARSPEELWAPYNDIEGDGKYAPDVPHLAVQGNIPLEYITFQNEGTWPEVPSSTNTLDQLKDAKAESDRGNYGRKAQILRSLMAEAPDEWEVDQDDGRHAVGVTHKPTGFRLHMPRTAMNLKRAYGGNDGGYVWERTPMLYGGGFDDKGIYGTKGRQLSPQDVIGILGRANELANHYGLQTNVDFRYGADEEVREALAGTGITDDEFYDGVPLSKYSQILEGMLERGELNGWSEGVGQYAAPLFYNTTVPPVEGAEPVGEMPWGKIYSDDSYRYHLDPMDLAYEEWELKNIPKVRAKRIKRSRRGTDYLSLAPDGSLVRAGEEGDDDWPGYPEEVIPGPGMVKSAEFMVPANPADPDDYSPEALAPWVEETTLRAQAAGMRPLGWTPYFTEQMEPGMVFEDGEGERWIASPQFGAEFPSTPWWDMGESAGLVDEPDWASEMEAEYGMGKTAVVERRGKDWVLLTKDGKRVLGTHGSAQEAHRQEYAIQKSEEARGKRASSLLEIPKKRASSLLSLPDSPVCGEKFNIAALSAKVAEALEPGERKPTLEEMREDIAGVMDKMGLDPEISFRTLGKEYSNLGPDALLDASRKLLAVNRGDAKPDDRDHKANQTWWSPDDFLEERVLKDAGRVGRNLLNKAAWRGNLDFMQSGHFTPQLEGMITGNSLSQAVSGINPVELFDLSHKVTQLGEGGIPSRDAVPMEARNVHPSHLGVLDYIRTPESASVGIDQRFASGLRKGKDRQVYVPVTHGGERTWRTPSELYGKTVAFPGQVDPDIVILD